ncbi:MAG: signal transduction histidine kinase [Bacteriovoracaceae bacterium]|jgi:signal transduction histidine kinase
MSEKNKSQNLEDKDISAEISMLYNISEIAQSVAYEINNPLMIIDGYSKKIKKNHGQSEYSDLSKDIDAIKKSSERINKIVTNLLTYSKENLTLPLEVIPFSSLVDKAIHLVKNEQDDFKAKISFDPMGSQDIEVNFSLCVQAIVNVISKSISHMRSMEHPEVNLSFREAGGFIELVIKDYGEKLSEKVQSQMFYQTFSTNIDGGILGMGMNSSFNIAKKFKGQLYFDDSYSENAFIFSFNSLK